MENLVVWRPLPGVRLFEQSVLAAVRPRWIASSNRTEAGKKIACYRVSRCVNARNRTVWSSLSDNVKRPHRQTGLPAWSLPLSAIQHPISQTNKTAPNLENCGVFAEPLIGGTKSFFKCTSVVKTYRSTWEAG